MPTPPEPPPLFDGPADDATDPAALVTGYLDWYRTTVLRKLDGLTDAQLSTPVAGFGWAPLGLVQHLGFVERRWLRWGFLAEPLDAYPRGEDEWVVTESPAVVVERYGRQVERSREILGNLPLDSPSRAGGRFDTEDDAPTLGRILFHLLQEYARHAGHLDAARQLIDGTVGE